MYWALFCTSPARDLGAGWWSRAVDRYAFARTVTDPVTAAPSINLVCGESAGVHADGSISLRVDKNGREEKTPKLMR